MTISLGAGVNIIKRLQIYDKVTQNNNTIFSILFTHIYIYIWGYIIMSTANVNFCKLENQYHGS